MSMNNNSSVGSATSPKQANTNASEVAKSTNEDVQIQSLAIPIAVWSKRKVQILSEYAITGNLTLSSSAVSEFSGSGVEDGSGTRRVADKYTQRLQSLERRTAEQSHDKMSMTSISSLNISLLDGLETYS
jgi:hypothetical protein